ncbi:DUF1656 domain-containing protein [Acidimangrovimonas sediminis]|uniref:DUF1656 domain-containing protein n=1 Tax=Acidimangrovimonas sediminis TaxID=2056283 RepID=UPI000C80B399|nr:DUF1656 domain-containing protein [Acidimangrovimonas sediminis]
MRQEFAAFGLFVPSLLICALIAGVIWLLVDSLMLRSGGWQFFWHPPIARLALYFLSLALVVFLFPDL